jgi:hypothetical protein
LFSNLFTDYSDCDIQSDGIHMESDVPLPPAGPPIEETFMHAAAAARRPADGGAVTLSREPSSVCVSSYLSLKRKEIKKNKEEDVCAMSSLLRRLLPSPGHV